MRINNQLKGAVEGEFYESFVIIFFSSDFDVTSLSIIFIMKKIILLTFVLTTQFEIEYSP